MQTNDFDYNLPKEFIAQCPSVTRDGSKLMVLKRNSGFIEHKSFRDVADYMEPGDCLVLNDTKVLPARVFGNILGKNSRIEILLLKNTGNDIWEILVKPGKKAKTEVVLEFKKDVLTGKIVGILPSGNRLMKFFYSGNFYNILDKLGTMPVPHYIKNGLIQKERYQTVYAKEEGSAAAPTAGLHFTHELLQKIKNKGVKIAYVTLHIGLGTFRPVKEDTVENHKMHTESYCISSANADLINSTKKSGKKVICVGTTSCRTLESIYKKYGLIRECNGETDIFIYPGFKFNVTNALITNFHLPKSTLIMLVSAFTSRESIINAYNVAIKNNYRFFSFGDAMLII